jgi:hypothetical protein
MSLYSPDEERVAGDFDAARKSVTRMCDDGLISASQRDRLMDTLADTTKATTADRHPIRIGDEVWDYDLRPCRIVSISTVSLDHREVNGAAIWWRTTTGMFDGTRLAWRHPSTRMTVAQVNRP